MTRESRRSEFLAAAVLVAVVAGLPLVAPNMYLIHVGTLVCTYWILICGLNLVIGYMGQLSIGHVGLLSVGAYCFAILGRDTGLSPVLLLVAAGIAGGLCGLILGLPSLRLPGFYFAMSTLAFTMIVNELLLAKKDITGGGAGIAAPGFPAPFDSPNGFYWLVAGIAMVVTVICWNIVRGKWGRAMVAIRDSTVAATALGISPYYVKLVIFVFSGVTAGIAGGLFASSQQFITTDTFHLELGMFFFICIVVGGRGSLLGPLLGTVLLTTLPEMVLSFSSVAGLIYGSVLLLVALLLPGGLTQAIEYLQRRLSRPRMTAEISPDLAVLGAAIRSGGRK